MYIEPNSVIRILKNVPLDKTYDHTIYFDSLTDQLNYFTGKTKYIFQRQSYQRVQRGWMRIEQQAEDLYDCNYLMFQNTAFGSKWFYAFIKSVEYINNKVSQIEFEIDVLQTWHFDYTLDDCFVEREHSATDGVFEEKNLVPEGLDLGEDYVNNSTNEFDLNDMDVCILATSNSTTQIVTGSTINNVYTPLTAWYGISANNAEALDETINTILQQRVIGETVEPSEIVAIYQYPAWLSTPDKEAKQEAFNIPINTGNLDGYVPKNKKLYSYPYNFLLVSNNNGQTAEYKYENWVTIAQAKFTAVGVFLSTPCVMIYPNQYRGITSDYDSGLTISSFPQCAWVGDTFKAWWAQNRASVVTSGISSVLSAVTTVGALGNPALATASTGTQFLAQYGAATAVNHASMNAKQMMAKIKDLKNTPPQVHGQTQTDSLNAGIGRIQFNFYAMSIKSAVARRIDEYFDRYGYATNRNKKPNRNVRPHWCFCKTGGCTISGSIPCDDVQKICSIYDSGITWWKNGDEVGDYSLDNTVS